MSVHLRRRTLKRVGILTTVAALGALATAGIATANLPGSTFEGNDGNLVVNTAGNTDWINAPNRVTGLDKFADKTDNSFGQGTKEDDPNVTIVTGSIPPNKNDLTRFYVASEFTNNSNYLYLAWERLVNIGSANLDLELNQNPTTGFTGSTTGPITLNRTAGDILITFDFSGSGTPTLGLLKWVTTGATSQCFSANALPCWGNRVNLSAAGFAEGAVNTGTIAEPIAGGTLTAGLFGEAAVNLTGAGVFPPGTCEAFGSTFLKSRSSSSFPAEIKDFVAPQPVNIANCGQINIIKHSDPRGQNQNFGYTSTIPATAGWCRPRVADHPRHRQHRALPERVRRHVHRHGGRRSGELRLRESDLHGGRRWQLHDVRQDRDDYRGPEQHGDLHLYQPIADRGDTGHEDPQTRGGRPR
jgi:hypothetical protein